VASGFVVSGCVPAVCGVGALGAHLRACAAREALRR